MTIGKPTVITLGVTKMNTDERIKMAKYLVTIEFSSEWSNPRKWNIDEILSLEEGESAEIIKIEEVK